MSDFETLLAEILRFRDERDWAQFHTPKNLATALGIEVAELQELLLWKTDQEVRQVLSDRDKREAVARELADIAIYTILVAHAAGVELGSAIMEKLKHNAEKYPVEKARGNATKYTELK